MNFSTHDPLVTIAIPCCNEKEYIERALASARVQTYQNIEIVISDGGSVDGTTEILSKLEPCKRVKVLFNPIGTLTKFDNWENLIEAVSGEFVLILPAKHVLYPACIQTLIAPFILDSTLGYVRACMGWKHVNGVKQNIIPAMLSGKQESSAELKRLFRGNVCETISTLYRTEAFRKTLPLDRRLARTFVWKINAMLAQEAPSYFLNIDVAEWVDDPRRNVIDSKVRLLINELGILYKELSLLAKSLGLEIKSKNLHDQNVNQLKLELIRPTFYSNSRLDLFKTFLRKIIFRKFNVF